MVGPAANEARGLPAGAGLKGLPSMLRGDAGRISRSMLQLDMTSASLPYPMTAVLTSHTRGYRCIVMPVPCGCNRFVLLGLTRCKLVALAWCALNMWPLGLPVCSEGGRPANAHAASD